MAVDYVFGEVAYRILNRFSPGFAVKLELKPFLFVNCLQELVSDVDRDVEVGKRVLIVLGMNETQHVRMRDAHHAHVGAATDATLLHDISHLIDDVHERDGAGSNAARRTNQSAVGAQKLVSHAGAAAGLVNGRCRFGVLHDSGYRVRHVEHEAGRQLAIGFAGVDQAGRVRHKLASQHYLAHCRKK